MAAVHNKELLLRWYLITLGLREIAKSRLPRKSTCGGEIVPHHEPTPPKSEWVISIEEKLTQGRQDNVPGSWAKLSIYQIPRHLKNGEDKDWVPQIVSLGPYHHRDKHLRHMERHKWRCLHRILERSGQDIGLYLDSVKQVERRARAYYEGRISMSRNKFVEMMVLDGCFVIEMFQGFAKGFKKLGYPPDDPVFSKQQGLIRQIQRDMIMLENQIPLLVLDRLLGLQPGNTNQKECVAELAIQFFDPLKPKFRTWPEVDSVRLVFDPLFYPVHCLEAFRRSFQYLGPKRPQTKSRPHCHTRCLTDLRDTGIKIRVDLLRPFGDIELNDGILEIPGLPIGEVTRSLFLNWIAFEQSHFDCSNYVTSYVFFMRDLVRSPKDVRYLCNRGIISHRFESDAQVVDLFNRLCQEVAFNIEDSYLQQLALDLHRYYHFKFTSFYADDLPSVTCYDVESYFLLLSCCAWRAFLTRKWNAWVSILKNKYFDNPWSIISLIAASVLLVLTFMQTFYTAYDYYKLRS